MKLTPREEQVTILVAQGMTNREIAVKLIISERTVEDHVRNAMSKVDARSRVRLAVWWVKDGANNGNGKET